MLYCPNYTCQTPNPEHYKYCQKCRTPLPRHYLWAVGSGVEACRPGELFANRYLCKSSRIFLDTKPGLSPTASIQMPDGFLPYLRLSPYQIHVPQIYDLVSEANGTGNQVLLLDLAALQVPIAPNEGAEFLSEADAAKVQLLPALIDVWESVTALRQLNWLWQIAHLWQPLSLEQVASSLLAPELLRVEGSIVRLLELRTDENESIATLPALGQLWSTWVNTARPAVSPFLAQVCQQLIQGEIRNAEQLVGALDRELARVGRSHTRHIQLATATDQGPSRSRNEDSCYPPGGTVSTVSDSNQPPALVIVCDGIGGHQGGDVASNLAIESVWQQVQALDLASYDPITLTERLEESVGVANDLISQRNDREQRHERQRMGTTLVMALAREHELYITHVGDSRAYWITRRSCHQVTLDDDVASREVRLGYGFYREALQQPSAGSLVQALGMGSSATLHPTVQRFVMDEDGIFLLCSDGLSDYNRVEEYWETVLLPVLDGKADLATVAKQLIEIANTVNGHDNVTVGLLHIRVTAPAQEMSVASGRTSQVGDRSLTQQTRPVGGIAPAPVAAAPGSPSTLKTQLLPDRRPKPSLLPLLLGIIVLCGIAGVLAYFLFPSIGRRVDPILGLEPNSQPAETPIAPSPVASPTPLQELRVGTLMAIAPVEATGESASLRVLPQPGSVSSPTLPDAAIDRSIPVGSIVQVVTKQGTTQTDRWVQLKVCSVPLDGGSVSPGSVQVGQFLTPGENGWVQESVVIPLAQTSLTLTPEQRGACGVSSPATSPTPDAPSPNASPALPS